MKINRRSHRRVGQRTSSGKRSKFEERVEATIKEAGIQVEYESSSLPYSLHLSYKPDWTVGDGVFLEAKGRFDYIERRKLLAVIDSNPDVTIGMIFMRNQKISKNSKTTYGSWCDKHGIPWSVYPELPNLKDKTK